jgi:phosphate transport system ATP-binding protein
LRALNRMNDAIPGVHVTGEVPLDDANIYAPSVDVVALRQRVVWSSNVPIPSRKASMTMSPLACAF